MKQIAKGFSYLNLLFLMTTVATIVMREFA